MNRANIIVPRSAHRQNQSIATRDAATMVTEHWNTQDASLIERWLNMLAIERRLSKHTTISYSRDIAAFTRWCATCGITNLSSIDQHMVRQFAAASHRAGLNPRSIQRQLSALRGLCGFCIREGVLKANPTSDVRAPKAAKRLPAALDVDRMSRLLASNNSAATNSPSELSPFAMLRDRAIMELFYSSGLRLAELVGLDLANLDLGDRTVRVLGKGSKTRIVPVGAHAIKALNSWLSVRDTALHHPTTALFIGSTGKRLSARTVQRYVTRWARLQGIDVKVYPHLFRHSFATHLLESSQDLRGVQELLGHANISTTQVYTHLDFQHLARVYDQAHPRAKKRAEKNQNRNVSFPNPLD